MKNRMVVVLCACLLLVPCPALAGTVDDQIKSLQQQMEQMQQQMLELQHQLQQAQAEAAAARQHADQTAQEVEQQVTEVSGRFKVLDDLERRFGHIKLGGYVRSRWWTGDNQQHSFDVTEIAVNVRYDVSENISGEFHIWWHPSGNAGSVDGRTGRYSNWAGPDAFFESAFAEFRNLNIGPIKGTLLVGKARNRAFGITAAGGYRGRITSDYGLFYRSLSQSRITGLQYLLSYKRWTYNIALFNGWSIWGGGTTRNAGDWTPNWQTSKSVRLLRTGQMNVDDDYNKAVSMRLGWQVLSSLNVGATFFKQNLSDNDLTAFNDIMGRNLLGTATTDDEHMLYGLDLTFEKGPFVLKSEAFMGEVADVDGNWLYVIAGYKFPRLKADFFLRYAAANYDQHRISNVTGSGAWDKRQITPLIVYHLHPRAKLYFEYYINLENAPSGAHHVEDNYGFVELILFY